MYFMGHYRMLQYVSVADTLSARKIKGPFMGPFVFLAEKGYDRLV
jgi:hypothetical protein